MRVRGGALKAFGLVLITLGYPVSASNPAGAAFLAENKQKQGVIEMPSDPTIDSPCACHYAGRLINGDEFDSSYGRGAPSTFAPNQVILGWLEAMQMMVEGDQWEIYVPSELAYGDRGSPPKIGSGDVLIFVMELVKIKGATVPAEPRELDTGGDAGIAAESTDLAGGRHQAGNAEGRAARIAERIKRREAVKRRMKMRREHL